MTQYLSNITTSPMTYTLTGEQGTRPEPPPKGLINTRCVQTKAGWVGQVIVDRDIVHETRRYEDGEDAAQAANAFVVERVKRLLGWEPPPDIDDVVDAAQARHTSEQASQNRPVE